MKSGSKAPLQVVYFSSGMPHGSHIRGHGSAAAPPVKVIVDSNQAKQETRNYRYFFKQQRSMSMRLAGRAAFTLMKIEPIPIDQTK
jgi:hypothetical protein